MSMLHSLRDSFSGRLITSDDETAPFLLDWRKRYRGSALAVAQPDTAADVAAIVRWCLEQRIAIVPQGGNTGLVGGAVADRGSHCIVLSLARLNRIRSIDPVNNTLTAEAGVILAEIQHAAQSANRLFPLSLAAEGSCTIGGNLSTNAGGVQVLRYGNARDLCLGLEVVTAQGDLWHGLRGLRKDNTGYDLRDLYIGSEGTLGIITAATLKVFPVPAAQITALAAVNNPQSAMALLDLAQSNLAAGLTAFELISERCLDLVESHYPQCRRPLATRTPYYVLLEYSDFEDTDHAQQRFESLMAQAIERSIASDAAMATSLAQAEALWALRESIPQAQALEGRNIKHDIAVPISSIARFITETEQLIEHQFPGVRMVIFGHLGDGNLHYNVSAPVDGRGDEFLAHEAAINRIVHDAVAAHSGSISAEHGIGQLKRAENERYKSAIEISLMKRIKRALDPAGIMNPGKVLPD